MPTNIVPNAIPSIVTTLPAPNDGEIANSASLTQFVTPLTDDSEAFRLLTYGGGMRRKVTVASNTSMSVYPLGAVVLQTGGVWKAYAHTVTSALNPTTMAGGVLAASTRYWVYAYNNAGALGFTVSVRDQKNEIRLAQAMSVYEFESLIPRPQDRSGSSPELAVITGYRPPTYLSSNSANTGVSSSNSDYSMALYPIPGDGRAINLTYVYRHPELVATTDKLKGVPSHIVDTIIMLTHGKARMTIEKDIAGGSAIIDRISRSFAAKAQGENPDPFRRKPMRSLDHKSQTDWPHGRYPRPFYTP
jgi:hypothetical protein